MAPGVAASFQCFLSLLCSQGFIAGPHPLPQRALGSPPWGDGVAETARAPALWELPTGEMPALRKGSSLRSGFSEAEPEAGIWCS